MIWNTENVGTLLQRVRQENNRHVSVTFRGRQGYSKDIGKYRKPDGQLAPKRFWLGHDQKRAIWVASVYVGTFEIFVKPHGGVWDDKALRMASLAVDLEDTSTKVVVRSLQQAGQELAQRIPLPELPDLPPLPAPAQTAPAQPAAMLSNPPTAKATLYAAIEAYKDAIKAKRKSDKHKERAAQVVDVNLKAARKDCPLADIDFAWIDSLCDYYKNRPGNLKDGKPMKPAGVANVLRYLRLFFVWLDDTEYGGWQAPRKLLKPFRVRQTDLMSPAEIREASTIKQFDLPTLVKLYTAGSDRQRAIMLAALFTGGTQQELAVLEKSEFDLDAGKLVHHRNKTKVLGEFWLPPELVDHLRKDFAKRPKDPLAFRTADGNPLVSFENGKQTSDAVRQMWDDLREEAELPHALPFKYIRKFVGDWMTRHGGEVIGQVALSHASQTVLGKHYTDARPFEQFNRLQQQLHAELKAAGMFDVAEKKDEEPKAKRKKRKTTRHK